MAEESSEMELIQKDLDFIWFFWENGQKVEVPKLPILRKNSQFYPPGEVKLPDGTPRQIYVEPKSSFESTLTSKG